MMHSFVDKLMIDEYAVYNCTFKSVLLFADNINRVCLRPGGQKGSDYINASFIDVSGLFIYSFVNLLLIYFTLLNELIIPALKF